MNIRNFIPALLLLLMACEGNQNFHGENIAESSFYVRGNCSMCEKRIEKTAKDIEGVLKADWEVKSKMLTVSFDSTRIDESTIHMAVANVGHETKEHPMNEAAHEDLPECCKKHSKAHE